MTMHIKYLKFFVTALASTLCLVILYSKLKNVTQPHRDGTGISTATAAVRKTFTPTTDIKKKAKKVRVYKFPPLTISKIFRQGIPKNGAYWNRKLHTLLRQVDGAENQMHEDPRSRFQCQSENFELLQTNIEDVQSYPLLYLDFLKGMNCRDPPIIIDQPGKCESATKEDQIFLVFAIKSTPKHFERRQAVRETWGREGSYKNGVQVRTVFLLGRSSVDDPSLDKLVSLEAQEFKDILVWDFQDSFYNLTLKEHVFLKWMLDNCPHVSFIFKGDDDVFANTQAILNHLLYLEHAQALSLYSGQIISNASPLRSPKIKYYVPRSFYEGPYPPYAGGGGFLFSGHLLSSLYHVSFYIPFFPIDDVYTGMCFKALGITPVRHSGFQTFDIRKEDRENACAHKDLLLVHQRDPQQTIRLWKSIHSPKLAC